MDGVGWVRLLGPVEAGARASPVAVGGPIVRLLLVQLVLSGGRTVSDDQAIDAVWGEWPPDSVASALRVHMTKLRSSVRQLGWIVDRRHHGYAMVIGPARCDLDDLDEWEAEAASCAPAAALAAAEEALSLWRGPSLTDVRRLPLGERLAASFDRRYEGLVDRRLELLLQLGRTKEVLAPLDRLVREDPLNEARWAMLATALYRSGHPAQALRSLQDARKALAEHAGLSPGPLLRDLERKILHHEIDQLAPVPKPPVTVRSNEVPGDLDAQAPMRLIGRDEVLNDLADSLIDVRTRGASKVVRLHGESGVGKSAVVAHFARHAAAEAHVLYGWAEQDAPHPFGVFTAPLKEVVAGAPELRDRPVLERLLGWSAGDPMSGAQDPAVARASALDAVRSVLTAAVGDQPLVVILDDVQWADELSISVLRSLARHPLARPLLMVAVERDGPASVVAGRGVTDLALRPLTSGDIASWAGRQQVDEWSTRALQLTGGLPLLLQDVLACTRDGEDLARIEPAVGQRFLVDRSAGLPAPAHDALAAAAVIGTSFRFEDVGALTDRDHLRLLEDLDSAQRAGILEYDRSHPGAFHFTHDLLRLAVLERTAPMQRMRLHARALKSIDDLPVLAAIHHAHAADLLVPPAVLVEVTEAAARALLDGYGFQSAKRILQTTLDKLGTAIGAKPRATLLMLLARATTGVGEGASARALFSEALELALEADDAPIVAEIVVSESYLGHDFAPDPGAPVRLERLLAELPAAARELRFHVLRQLVFTHLCEGRLDHADSALHRARSLAQELGTVSAEAAVLNLEHWRHEDAADPRRRREVVARIEELADLDPDPRVRSRLLGMRLVERLHQGDSARADQVAQELSDLGVACGDPNVEWLGLAARFNHPMLNGKVESAILAADLACTRGDQIGIEGVARAYGAQAYVVGWVTGDLLGFTQPLEALGFAGPDLLLGGARSLALAVSDRPREAAIELESIHLDIASAGTWLHFVGLVLAVETAVMVGDLRVLERAVPVLRRRLGDHVVLGTGVLDLGPVARYLGLALHGVGQRDEAIDLLDSVGSDPASGALWQERAAIDLRRIDVEASWNGGTTAAPNVWQWLHLAAPPTSSRA